MLPVDTSANLTTYGLVILEIRIYALYALSKRVMSLMIVISFASLGVALAQGFGITCESGISYLILAILPFLPRPLNSCHLCPRL